MPRRTNLISHSTFSHRLAKVILKFVDLEKNPLEVSNVRIEGMQTEASFNVQTDVLTVDESSVATITPYHNATTGSTRLLFFLRR